MIDDDDDPWTVLPAAGRQGPPPPLPNFREWSPRTRVWWAKLWALPQATQWEGSGGMGLFRMAGYIEDLLSGSTGEFIRNDVMWALGEIREEDDAYGVTPRAMAALRWRIEGQDSDDPPDPYELERQRRKAELNVVDGDNDDSSAS